MEWLDIVDEEGNPTGETVERTEAHAEGIRHRTAHVWLLRRCPDGVEVLLQKRSAGKDSFPGCYDISSAGHIPAGCGFLESAMRELSEELGLEAAPEEFIYCGRRQIFHKDRFHGRDFVDCQVTNVYCLWKDVDPEELALQESELESVRWMKLSECKRLVRENGFKHCIYEEELNLLPRE